MEPTLTDAPIVALAMWAIAWSFFGTILILRDKRKNNEPGPIVYDFEDSSAGRLAWHIFLKMDVEERHKLFPSILKKRDSLALPPGIKAYLLKDAALINSPSGEFIQGTMEIKQDEGTGD